VRVHRITRVITPWPLACGRFESPAFASRSRCPLGLEPETVALRSTTVLGYIGASARRAAFSSAAARRLVFTGGGGVTKITGGGVAAHRRTYLIYRTQRHRILYR